LTTSVRRLGLAVVFFVRFGLVVAFVVRFGLDRRRGAGFPHFCAGADGETDDWLLELLVTGLVVDVVIEPLAAVIGASTVVMVVVVVTVLKVMVTGPHVTTVGRLPVRTTCPH
jgi:hypothetical protein